MQPEISIIVPAYNTADYIRECIDSVLTQSFTSYEVIVVDDGSTDETAGILKEYADRNDSIKLIRQENAGQSVARNHGLRKATGRYVVFIDSDDLLASPKALAKMHIAIKSSEADFVQCGFSFIKSGDKLSAYCISETEPARGKQILIDMLRVNNLYTSPWAKIYSRDFLKRHNLFFPEGIVNEDTTFSIMIATVANKVAFLSDCVYCSWEREGSTSRTSFKRMFQTMDAALKLALKFMNEKGRCDHEIHQLYEARYVRSMLYNLMQSAQRLKYSAFLDDYNFCMENTDYRQYRGACNQLPVKHRIMALLSKHPMALFAAMRTLNLLSVRMH